jgi:hypothetical protein
LARDEKQFANVRSRSSIRSHHEEIRNVFNISGSNEWNGVFEAFGCPISLPEPNGHVAKELPQLGVSDRCLTGEVNPKTGGRRCLAVLPTDVVDAEIPQMK